MAEENCLSKLLFAVEELKRRNKEREADILALGLAAQCSKLNEMALSFF